MVPENTSLGILQDGTAKMSNFKDNDKIRRVYSNSVKKVYYWEYKSPQIKRVLCSDFSTRGITIRKGGGESNLKGT